MISSNGWTSVAAWRRFLCQVSPQPRLCRRRRGGAPAWTNPDSRPQQAPFLCRIFVSHRGPWELIPVLASPPPRRPAQRGPPPPVPLQQAPLGLPPQAWAWSRARRVPARLRPRCPLVAISMATALWTGSQELLRKSCLRLFRNRRLHLLRRLLEAPVPSPTS